MVIPIVTHNTDRSVTRNEFKDATHLYVSGAWLTIQGEGPYAGHPAVFVRLAGCNFGDKTNFCQFCDTNFKMENATKITPSELANLLTTLRGNRKSVILVITGGEPTLQPLILDVLVRLEHVGPSFEIFQFESNGTNPQFSQQLRQLPEEIFGKVCFGVSPKANYKTKECMKIPFDVLNMIEMNGFLKFVIDADEDSPHHELPDWAFDLMANSMIPVYVSPMARYLRAPEGEVASVWDATLVDHEATKKNYEYAAQYVLQHDGLKLSLQTHLFVNLA